MRYKAVLFDLFETLVTEWGHEKYTKNQMCADLGIERAQFDLFWEEGEEKRFLGEVSFESSLRYVCAQCQKTVTESVIREVILLSYEVHRKKPEEGIYREAAKRLGVSVEECLFVGDGGSEELEGAKAVGMGAVQAKWYTNQHPGKRENIEGVWKAEEPLEVLKLLYRSAENDKFRFRP